MRTIMVNRVMHSGDGLALEVTAPARAAQLVEEDSDGTPTRLADVYVYSFDDLILIIEGTRISTSDRAELVETAARDTDSIYRGSLTTLEVVENGYQVPLPGSLDAGFSVDDRAPVIAREGFLVIHDGSKSRLASELAAIRDQQIRT